MATDLAWTEFAGIEMGWILVDDWYLISFRFGLFITEALRR
jgi:hypothetical protein